MIAKYVKKPVTIEAVQWTGDNIDEIREFAGDVVSYEDSVMHLSTLEGTVVASVDDYIIKGINGEFYPCKPDIFVRTYDGVSHE